MPLDEVQKKSKVPLSFLEEAAKSFIKNGLDSTLEQGENTLNDIIAEQGYEVQPEIAASSWQTYSTNDNTDLPQEEASPLGVSQFEEYLRQQTGAPTEEELVAQRRQQLNPKVQLEDSVKAFAENYIPEPESETPIDINELNNIAQNFLPKDQEYLSEEDRMAELLERSQRDLEEALQQETPEWLASLKADPANLSSWLFTGTGPLNPNNWPIVGQSQSERARSIENASYRTANPMKENALVYNGSTVLSSDDTRKVYEDYFDSQGGLEQSYETGGSMINRALSSASPEMLQDPQFAEYASYLNVEPDRLGLIGQGLDKMSRENFDDGTMRADSVKGKYMLGSVYKQYVALGMGGRPIDEIEDNAVYNKLDEMRDYNFVPYITDENQFRSWTASQMFDDISTAYNAFSQARDRFTDANYNYNGQRISRQDLYDHVGDYYKDLNEYFENAELINSSIVPPDDPSVDDSYVPIKKVWQVPLDDGSVESIESDYDPICTYDSNNNIIAYWPDVDRVITYNDEADFEENFPRYIYMFSSDEGHISGYLPLPVLEYEQSDGTSVRLPFLDVENLIEQISDGSASVDYGWGNIAKDAADRKGWEEMVTSFDFSDILPNMIDLSAGSAPLFLPYTAWPMALANAGSATQGLDARSHNFNNNTYSRLAEDMNGEKYVANTVLSGLVPMTERFAGIIGGSGGFIGKPIQNLLKKVGAPTAARYGVDVLGEGMEENVASAWEDYQVNGLANWFADPIVDENGEVLYDSTGHELRNPETPITARIGNYIRQLPENFLAGTALGGAFGAPRILSDAASNSGYFTESMEDKILREIEEQYNLPHFKEARRGNNLIRITPEDFTLREKRNNG